MQPRKTLDTAVTEFVQAIGLLVRRIRAACGSHELSWTESFVIARLAKDGPATTAELARAASRPTPEQTFRDDELSLIFMCCHPAIPPDSRIALSLKTACGFSVREIARAFLAEDAAIAQRIVRAKKQIRDQALSIEMPAATISISATTPSWR